MFGDGVGLEADPHTFLDIAPIGRAKNLGAVLKDPRKLAELAKDVARRKAQEKIRGTVLNWRKGDPIFDKTTKGNVPADSTVRARHWKNRSLEPGAVDEFGAKNVDRMKRGSAPQRKNQKTWECESRELHHHPVPRRHGGKEFIEVWPEEHARIDKYRRLRKR